MSSMRKPVVLIVGAGAGIGTHIARRFVPSFHAVLCRRSNAAALQETVDELNATAKDDGTPKHASGYLMDVTQHHRRNDDNDALLLEDVVDRIESTLGPIHCAVYNIGAQLGHRSLEETSVKQFERALQLGTVGLFRLAKAVLPRMAQRQQNDTSLPLPSLLVTSSTAAMRGNAGQHAHAAAMGGRRLLCQSLRDEYAGKIHVSHVVIDGAVNAPDTLGKLVGPELFTKLQEEPHRLMSPAAIAETYWQLAHQDASVQTFEVDLRSRLDTAWWNSSSPPSSRL